MQIGEVSPLNDVPATLPSKHQMNLNNKGLSIFIILPGDTLSLPHQATPATKKITNKPRGRLSRKLVVISARAKKGRAARECLTTIPTKIVKQSHSKHYIDLPKKQGSFYSANSQLELLAVLYNVEPPTVLASIIS